MKNKSPLTKILAILGTLLAWFPILAPVLLSLISLIQGRIFHFDYLMPAELFPFALVGGGLLFLVARWTRSRWKLIGYGLVAAVCLPVFGQAIASVTGLATGEIEPTGWEWALVLVIIAAFVLALVVVAVGGILLVRDLFKK